MKSFQVIALLLWGFIFIVAAFVLGQFLVSKDIFDVTEIIIGKKDNEQEPSTNVNGTEQADDTLANDVVINKVGQETIRVGYNIAKHYFEDYYVTYINYIIDNQDSYPYNQKTSITETLATDYVFYAISNSVDKEKYGIITDKENINIKESEVNSFIDTMFGKDIDNNYKIDGKYGYSDVEKTYSIEKNNNYKEYDINLENIENITSNELILTYSCKELNKNMKIDLTVIYKGGRYIVTGVENK